MQDFSPGGVSAVSQRRRGQSQLSERPESRRTARLSQRCMIICSIYTQEPENPKCLHRGQRQDPVARLSDVVASPVQTRWSTRHWPSHTLGWTQVMEACTGKAEAVKRTQCEDRKDYGVNTGRIHENESKAGPSRESPVDEYYQDKHNRANGCILSNHRLNVDISRRSTVLLRFGP